MYLKSGLKFEELNKLGDNGKQKVSKDFNLELISYKLQFLSIDEIKNPKEQENFSVEVVKSIKELAQAQEGEETHTAINPAYIEHSAYNGIGILKWMGHCRGFIALQASFGDGQLLNV
ncbi:hypothetical protein Adt_37373 [Abeliophyllum distichum]|uniref:Uncharacterized protein n=1 Tax=Abeliophyllum distichum TaxID=126358 RepID=A0ABD1QK97_9LAMI